MIRILKDYNDCSNELINIAYKRYYETLAELEILIYKGLNLKSFKEMFSEMYLRKYNETADKLLQGLEHSFEQNLLDESNYIYRCNKIRYKINELTELLQ